MNTLSLVFQVIAGLFAFVTLHELGHVLMARYFGDRDARFTVLGREDGRWIVATTFTRFESTENWPGVKVALAGPLFTRLMAELLGLALLLYIAAPLRPFFLTIFLLARTDFWLYTVRDFVVGHLARQPLPGRDISDAVRGGAALVGSTQGRLFALLLVVSTADLLLGWPRILNILIPGGL